MEDWEALQIAETGIGGGWNDPKFKEFQEEFGTMISIISGKDRVVEGIQKKGEVWFEKNL